MPLLAQHRLTYQPFAHLCQGSIHFGPWQHQMVLTQAKLLLEIQFRQNSQGSLIHACLRPNLSFAMKKPLEVKLLLSQDCFLS